MQQTRLCFTLLIAVLLLAGSLNGQNRNSREFRKGTATQEEMVSFSRTMRFQQVLPILNDLSRKFMGKSIRNLWYNTTLNTIFPAKQEKTKRVKALIAYEVIEELLAGITQEFTT